MSTPVVEMREVVKDFGGLRALAGLDLRVEPGEVVAFLGPNGAGKTIVLTTHYLEEADALADRIVVIDHGKIIADGSTSAIKSRVMRKHVHLETAKPLRKGILDGLPMGQLEMTGRSLNFVSPNPEEVLKKLFMEGIEVSNLEVVGANLEEAFLELTERRG